MSGRGELRPLTAHPHPRGCANTRVPVGSPLPRQFPPQTRANEGGFGRAGGRALPPTTAPPLPPCLCYDHLGPHFVKLQPQLPFVQKHFDPLHALRGKKAQAVSPERWGTGGESPAGGGRAPRGPTGKLGGKRPGDRSRSSWYARENPAAKPGKTGFQARAR